jgi:arylsulfatase A-like enzyme
MVCRRIESAPSKLRFRRALHMMVGTAVLVVVAVGCGVKREMATSHAVLRVIETGAQEIYEVREISTEVQVVDLSPRADLDDGGWHIDGSAVSRGFDNGRWQYRLNGDGKLRLIRDLPVRAAEIDVIEVEVVGLSPSGQIRLQWSEGDEKFRNRKSIRFGAREGSGTVNRVFRFDVGNHQSWTDGISSIRINLTTDNRNVQLGRVLGTRLDVDEDRLGTAFQTAWLVELDRNHRAAQLAHPAVPIERRVDLPDGATLDFGTGVPPTQREPVRFTVTAETGDAQGEGARVFDQWVDATETSGWSDHEIDLSAFAGRDVRLTFRVETERELDVLHGLPMWANPVVWAPAVENGPPNVVLISVDTLRADHMSLYGYSRPTTPKIDRWADRRAVVFDSVVAPSPWTLPSHVSMMTGIDALGHGVNHAAPATSTLLMLAEMLRSHGYATAAVTGGSYLHPRFGLAQGFESYRSYKGDLSIEFQTELDATMDWFGENADRAPFFFFFHTYEVHDPYEPREPFFSRFAESALDPGFRDGVTRPARGNRPDRLRNTNQFFLRRAEDGSVEPLDWNDVGIITDLYDSGIAYADHHLGALLDRLSEPDLVDNTLVVFTSDHGEAMGEHRLAGHSSLYDHDLMVPLLVALPGGTHRGTRVGSQVRTVDIAATVLDVIGLPRPPGMDGNSLIPLIEGEERGSRPAESYAALSNHGLAVRSGEGDKYIFRNLPWHIPIGWEQLFDLETDPGETKNLAESSPKTAGYRTSVVAAMQQRQSGLRLDLANRGDEMCRLEIRGRGLTIGSNTIKTTRLGGGCRVLEAGAVGCDLAAGGEMKLIAERVTTPSVEISGVVIFGADERRYPFSLEYEIGSDLEPSAVAIGGDGDRGDGGVEIAVEWVGDVGVLGLDPSDFDDELRQQLEALGYIQ